MAKGDCEAFLGSDMDVDGEAEADTDADADLRNEGD
jgi:hypothetical protein